MYHPNDSIEWAREQHSRNITKCASCSSVDAIVKAVDDNDTSDFAVTSSSQVVEPPYAYVSRCCRSLNLLDVSIYWIALLIV